MEEGNPFFMDVEKDGNPTPRCHLTLQSTKSMFQSLICAPLLHVLALVDDVWADFGQ